MTTLVESQPILSVDAAARMAECSPDNLRYAFHRGKLNMVEMMIDGRRRLMVREKDLQVYVRAKLADARKNKAIVEDPDWITARVAAKRLGVSSSRVHALIANEKLESVDAIHNTRLTKFVRVDQVEELRTQRESPVSLEDYIPSAVIAETLGISSGRVSQLINEGRLEGAWSEDRRTRLISKASLKAEQARRDHT